MTNTERLYELAKAGSWTQVLADLALSGNLAVRAARYVKESSGWTFLHQAAYFGREDAVRALIAAGASLACKSKHGETAAYVAAKQGFQDLAKLMKGASMFGDDLWSPSPDENLLPSSSAWEEAVERRAAGEMIVAYAGGSIVIRAGSRYFVDSFERTLVGWHGSYDPPRGMDGESMLNARRPS